MARHRDGGRRRGDHGGSLQRRDQVASSRSGPTGALEMGTHTITIERLGTKNASSKGTSINVDAFDVTGSLN